MCTEWGRSYVCRVLNGAKMITGYNIHDHQLSAAPADVILITYD